MVETISGRNQLVGEISHRIASGLLIDALGFDRFDGLSSDDEFFVGRYDPDLDLTFCCVIDTLFFIGKFADRLVFRRAQRDT